jgi:hypothetical protein
MCALGVRSSTIRAECRGPHRFLITPLDDVNPEWLETFIANRHLQIYLDHRGHAFQDAKAPANGIYVLPAILTHEPAHLKTMRVLVLNPAGAPLNVLTGAEAVAVRVFHRAGIEPMWRHASDRRGDSDAGPAEDLTSVVIVNLMSASMEARLRQPPTAVGFAVSGGRLANIVYERVERLAQGTSTDLAIVLGHVMAHEIGHLLLPPNAHSAGGIMNATVNPLLAAQGVLWFSPAEAASLRIRLAALARTHDVQARSRLIGDPE